ncbi:GerAB/ArcD/ProY family transporter, partial [Effusibacillus consociatus]
MNRVSGNQIFWMIATMEIGMTILLTITPSVTEAKQSAWISALVAGGFGIFVAFLGTKLSLLYPRQTLIEYSQTILGKWLGKVIVIPYLIMWFINCGIILRQSAEIIVEYILPGTPLSVVILSLGLAIVFATLSGIEVIGRLSEMLGPVILVMILIALFLSFNNMKWENLLPVYPEGGLMSILKGAIGPAGFLGEVMMVTMFVSFMSKPTQAPSKTILAVGIASLFISVSMLFVLAILGPNVAGRMWYPFFTMVQMISIADFLTNVDAIVIVIWVGSVFIKLCLYFFIASFGSAQWLNVPKWTRMVWFVFPVATGLSLLPRNIVEASILVPEKLGAYDPASTVRRCTNRHEPNQDKGSGG